MLNIVIGAAMLVAFVGVTFAYARHANARDRYEATLNQMPAWWVRRQS